LRGDIIFRHGQKIMGVVDVVVSGLMLNKVVLPVVGFFCIVINYK